MLSSTLKDEQGSILVVALLMLVLLTMLGISISTTTEIEIQISGNERLRKTTFYVAEAGIENVRAMLSARLIANNASRIAQAQDPLWTFALNGPDETNGTADDASVTYDNSVSSNDGAVWIPGGSLGNTTFTVTVWNNADGGGATVDSDSLIIVQSNATGPGGVNTTIEVSLLGAAGGEAITGYTAQAGAGAGKSYTADDLEAITDFTQQL